MIEGRLLWWWWFLTPAFSIISSEVGVGQLVSCFLERSCGGEVLAHIEGKELHHGLQVHYPPFHLGTRV